MTRSLSIFAEPRAFTDLAGWLDTADRLRAAAPVQRVEDPGYAPMWAVLGYDEVRAVERQPALFSCPVDPIIGSIERLDRERQLGLRPLTSMNDPEHGKYRALISPFFSPGNLRRLDALIDRVGGEVVARMEALDGECDFTDVAGIFPLRILMGMFGLPDEDLPVIGRFTKELFGSEDPELAKAGEQDKTAVLLEMFHYFKCIADQRRAEPTDDLASAMANGRVDGELLSDLDLIGYFATLAGAGHDTTTSSVVGGLEALIRHPDELARLRADPALIPGAIDEMLRWSSPVRHFMREVATDTELGGQNLKRGDRLYNSYLAANYDPAKFAEPRRFDPARTNAAEHLAFGFGPHFCIGHRLARMEMTAAFTHLLPRLDHVELREVPEQTASTFVGGLKHLHIDYKLTS